jgi:hypothetical protein
MSLREFDTDTTRAANAWDSCRQPCQIAHPLSHRPSPPAHRIVRKLPVRLEIRFASLERQPLQLSNARCLADDHSS